MLLSFHLLVHLFMQCSLSVCEVLRPHWEFKVEDLVPAPRWAFALCFSKCWVTRSHVVPWGHREGPAKSDWRQREGCSWRQQFLKWTLWNEKRLDQEGHEMKGVITSYWLQVLVHLGCLHRTPQNEWLINDTDLFVTVVEARHPRSRRWQIQRLMRDCFLVHRPPSFYCVLTR